VILIALVGRHLRVIAALSGRRRTTHAADVDAERRDGLAVDPARGLQATPLLERDQGLPGLRPELPIGDADVEALADQHQLDLANLIRAQILEGKGLTACASTTAAAAKLRATRSPGIDHGNDVAAPVDDHD